MEEVGLLEFISLDYEIIKKCSYISFFTRHEKKIQSYLLDEIKSLYENKNHGNYPKDGYLKEATRNDYFPIFENKNGVVIYRSYIISYMEYLKEIKDLNYGFIESYLIEDSKLVTYNGATHYAYLERKEEVIKEIRSFIK